MQKGGGVIEFFDLATVPSYSYRHNNKKKKGIS
jgi:hypothetical protein